MTTSRVKISFKGLGTIRNPKPAPLA